jgi:alpha-tubulin suppressor-like RCC1 family protein
VGVETDWEQVSAGQNQTCGIRASALYCWGDNSHTQLGVDVSEFTTERMLVPGVGSATRVSLDTFHTCFIEEGGGLFCFGRNIEGQLGDGTIDARLSPAAALPLGDWDQVSAGRFHTCGVRNGVVLCTGENVLGRLGVGDTVRRREFTPTIYFE